MSKGISEYVHFHIRHVTFPSVWCYFPHNSPYWILRKTPTRSWEIAYTKKHSFSTLIPPNLVHAPKLENCFLRCTPSIYLKFCNLFLIFRTVFQIAVSFINCPFLFLPMSGTWMNDCIETLGFFLQKRCTILHALSTSSSVVLHSLINHSWFFHSFCRRQFFYTPILTTFGNDKASYILFTVYSQPEFSGRNTESTIPDFLLGGAFWEGGVSSSS